jgi:putative hemolysin
VPILIRHYLKLNAKFIHFNVDRSFSNVVDGLIVVDLDAADHRIVKRFMGSEGWRRFSDNKEQANDDLQLAI